MTETSAGFTVQITKPTRDPERFVACVVIYPNRGGAAAKVQRNIGRKKAIQLVEKLLKRCDAPDELLERVRALRS